MSCLLLLITSDSEGHSNPALFSVAKWIIISIAVSLKDTALFSVAKPVVISGTR